MSGDLPEFSGNRIDFWFAYPGDFTLEELQQRHRQVLSRDEKERCDRFLYDRDRIGYLLAHVLLRQALSSYVPVPPSEWTFAYGTHGKPALSGPAAIPLEFNLSHTRGAVACAFAQYRSVGCDVQVNPGAGRLFEMGYRVFGASEMELLAKLRGRHQDRMATLLWTLKEAITKALGLGIHLPFAQVVFHPPGDSPACMARCPNSVDGKDWEFACLRMRSDFCASVAVRGVRSEPMRLRTHKLVGAALTPITTDLEVRASNSWIV